MNLSKCLFVFFLGLALLLCASFLAYVLTRKSQKGEPSPEPVPEAPSSPEGVDEARRRMEDQLRREHAEVLERARKQMEATIESLKAMKPEVKPLDIEKEFKTVDLELYMDVNIPGEGSSQYKSGGHTVIVSRDPSSADGVVKLTHFRPHGSFNISKVQFGGKSYPVPAHKEVLVLTALALEADPGFPYFLIFGEKSGAPRIFEFNGTEFVLNMDVQNFKDLMFQKAAAFGRISTTQPPARPHEPLIFDLAVNKDFEAAGNKFTVSKAFEFDDKYVKYFYMDSERPFSPGAFTINGETQHGLPIHEALRGLVVYMYNGDCGSPLLVKYICDDSRYFQRVGSSFWAILPEEDDLEKTLDLLDSRLSDRIVVNISRRSDYFRNGTGDSSLEVTKDVNVYVVVNSPDQGWNTYRHNLEVGGEGGQVRPFLVSKVMFGKSQLSVIPSEKCTMIEVYFKKDAKLNELPFAFRLLYESGNKEYYLLERSDYVSGSTFEPPVTDQTLLSTLEGLVNKKQTQ